MNMASVSAPRIRCRLISEPDIPALTELLARGFPVRSKAYWAHALERLARRDAPAQYPRFGYMLDCGDRPVGVVLMIFSLSDIGGEAKARCNISSWYVDPLYAGHASLLIAAAVRLKDVTYVNVSPATHTWPVIEAQGFRRYCDGQMLCIPTLGGSRSRAHAEQFDCRTDYGSALHKEERDILLEHQAYGCISFVIRERNDIHPFVFLRRRVFHEAIPTAQLVYCRGIEDFVRLSRVLGRALAWRGQFLALVDANEPVPGLVGIYRANRGPKYFKGPERPRIGDLAFSESILFGP
jgi:hypothetical protein